MHIHADFIQLQQQTRQSQKTFVLHSRTVQMCRCCDRVSPQLQAEVSTVVNLPWLRKVRGPRRQRSGPGEGAERTKDPRIPKVYEIFRETYQNLLLSLYLLPSTTIYYHPTTCMLSFASRSYSVSLVSLCKQREHFKLGIAGAKQHLYTANPSISLFLS